MFRGQGDRWNGDREIEGLVGGGDLYRAHDSQRSVAEPVLSQGLVVAEPRYARRVSRLGNPRDERHYDCLCQRPDARQKMGRRSISPCASVVGSIPSDP